jgi:N12 class adenine-specific DNA methylase
MKECTKCFETKELSEFQKNKSTSDGYQKQCKSCRSGIKIEISPEDMKILEKEVLKVIDENTWNSKIKIRWNKLRETLKQADYKDKKKKVNIDIIFEDVIYNLKFKQLITSRNFLDIYPTQEGLRPTTKGHELVQVGGA